MEPRQAAARVLTEVLRDGRSLSAALPAGLARVAPAQRPLVQALCYGVLRWYPRLAALVARLLERPLRDKDTDVQALLLIGLYQLLYQGVPAHAAVAETVKATAALRKSWARGLVNAVLRNFLRQGDALQQAVDRDPSARLAHPRWLLDRLRIAWPADWEAIATAANRQAPMTLRVNARRSTSADYLAGLQASGIAAQPAPHVRQGITLRQACNVEELPGFAAGLVSVQDAAAQLAAELLAPAPGERVLDACAAPGGKTAHLLEVQPQLDSLVAVDIDAERMKQVQSNLERLGLGAELVVGDAAEPQSWWDGRAFDAILLDAPCSATGVIRRHPDIKVLRRAEDVDGLTQRQASLLNAVWALLRPGGRLLYATCSILPEENTEQVRRFLQSHADARLGPIAAAWGRETEAGRQILPGEDDMDGFYYACLYKQ